MKRQLIQFSPQVTAGNLLQMLTIGGAIISAWVNIQNRVTGNEVRVQALTVSVEHVTEAQARTAQALDRVAARMSDHIRFGAQ